MFPLQRSGELCFSSISSSSDPNYQPPADPNILRQDHVFKIIHNNNNNNGAVASSAPLQIITSTGQNKIVFSAANNSNTKMSRSKRLATSNEDDEEEESGENNKDHQSSSSSKKKKHREVEKLRRQEMASLFVSLRSLLPLEFIRGKRSISDHINEAVNYIRHLEAKKKELESKRNALIKIISSNSSSSCVDSKDGIRKSSNTVIVQPWCSGTQILISTGAFTQQQAVFPLSLVMELLSQQGLNVVSSLSTQLNNTTLIHKIYCEAANEESSPMNPTELCKKLEEVIGG